MNSYKKWLLPVALILILSGLTLPKPKCADLAVIKIYRPDYNAEIDGSTIVVKIANLGRKPSVPVRAKLSDVDMSYEEGMALGYDTLVVQLLAENNGRGSYYAKRQPGNPDVNSLDYDLYIEDMVEIPAIQPGDSAEVIFNIEGHWIYDSNCEIEVELDSEHQLKECDNENNKLRFFEWG